MAHSHTSIALTLPTVNINGTSRKELLDGYLACMGQVQLCIAALGAIAPNGRDYPNRDVPLVSATREHRDRLLRLMAIRDELNVLAGSVSK